MYNAYKFCDDNNIIVADDSEAVEKISKNYVFLENNKYKNIN